MRFWHTAVGFVGIALTLAIVLLVVGPDEGPKPTAVDAHASAPSAERLPRGLRRQLDADPRQIDEVTCRSPGDSDTATDRGSAATRVPTRTICLIKFPKVHLAPPRR